MTSRKLSRYRILALILLVPILMGIIVVVKPTYVVVRLWGLMERGVLDPYNRSVGPKRVVAEIRKAGIDNIAVCLCSADKEVRLSRDDSLGTAASIYGRGGPEPRPGIVLIHGNTALGRKLAIYKVLASKLAAKGYIVLAFDQPGFGESENPYGFGTLEALDETKMVAAAAQYLIENEHVDKESLSVIGHSLGTVAALKAGLAMDEIKNIILIGPARRWRERLANPNIRTYFWHRAQETHRFVYGAQIPDWYTIDTWTERAQQWALEYHIEYFSRKEHKPLMLVDGEREKEEEKRYLEEYYSALAEPKTFVRLRRSDHYGNTAQSMGVVFYDERVMSQLVDEISRWLTQSYRS